MAANSLITFTNTWPPYLYTYGNQSSNLRVDGPLAFLLSSFATYMNFSIRLLDQNHDWGECDVDDQCNNYLSLVKMKKINLSIYPVILSAEEFAFGKYTNAIEVTDLTAIVGIPSPNGQMFAFFTAIDVQSWVVLILTVNALYLSLMFVEYIENHCRQISQSRIFGIPIWHLLQILLTGASTWKIANDPLRILTIFWVMGRFIFFSIYSGDMTSTFFMTTYPDYIRYIDDFLQFPHVTPLIWNNSVEAAFFENNPDTPYKEVWQRIQQRNSFIGQSDVYDTPVVLADKIQTTMFSWICLQTDTIYLLRTELINQDCRRRNYHLAKPFSNIFLSLILQKDISPEFLEEINRRILRMQQAAVLNNEFHENKHDHRKCLDRRIVPDAVTLSLQGMRGVFLVWFCGVLCSLSVLFIEHLHFSLRRQIKVL